MNKNLQHFMPHLVAIAIFFIVTFLFFNPLFQGKIIEQQDIKQHRGMAKEIMDYRQQNDGEEPLWTNSMFGGMPAYQISVQHSTNLVKIIDKYIFRLSIPRPADYFFLYLIGFYILLLVLRVNPYLGIVGALAFAFSSYFIIILEAGHNSKAHAIGYMAPVLASIILTFRKKYILGGLLTALFMALQLNANHPQITYYLLIIVLFYGIYQFIEIVKEKEFAHFFKTIGILAFAVALGFSTNFTNYITTLEYSPYTIRGASELSFDEDNKSDGLDRDYATQWSYGKGESFSLLIPNIKGGETKALGQADREILKDVNPQFRQNIAGMNKYWGDQPFTSGPVYIGAIVFFLAILAMFIVKSRMKWALFAAAVLALFLSWGHNMMWFTNIFMDYVPAYNKFRAVSMILVIVQFSMAVLAALALKAIFENPGIIKENRKAFYLSFGLSGGLSLLLYLFPNMFFDFLSKMEVAQFNQLLMENPQYQPLFDELKEVRANILKSDAIRSFGFILVASLVIFIYDFKKMPKYVFAAIIAVLFLIDLAVIDRRYINDDNYIRKPRNNQLHFPTKADLQIMQDPDHPSHKKSSFRVFNQTVSTFNDASTSYFHHSIGGYHGAKLRRYQDLIDYHISNGNMKVINMLNTKYFIQNDRNNQATPRLNTGAMGNAWFVNKVDWVNSPDMEIIHLETVIEIKNLDDNGMLRLYGRELRPTDTLMLNSEIEIASDEENIIGKINFSDFRFAEGISYVLGNNPHDSSAHFINLSDKEYSKFIAEKQFEVRIIHTFNPHSTAIINTKFKDQINDNIQFEPSSNIELVSYEPNHLIYQSNTNSDQLAVFSEIYYDKGWKAFIDGKQTDFVQANYVLRAMNIPGGEHQIEFKFEPKSYFIGKWVNLFASLSLIIIVLGLLVYMAKNQFLNKHLGSSE